MSLHLRTTEFHLSGLSGTLAFQHFLAPVVTARHELLWDCYLSGQLSDAELEREIEGDSSFGSYVAALRQRH